jgi:hypothetical protein
MFPKRPNHHHTLFSKAEYSTCNQTDSPSRRGGRYVGHRGRRGRGEAGEADSALFFAAEGHGFWMVWEVRVVGWWVGASWGLTSDAETR